MDLIALDWKYKFLKKGALTLKSEFRKDVSKLREPSKASSLEYLLNSPVHAKTWDGKHAF